MVKAILVVADSWKLNVANLPLDLYAWFCEPIAVIHQVLHKNDRGSHHHFISLMDEFIISNFLEKNHLPVLSKMSKQNIIYNPLFFLTATNFPETESK